MVSASQIRPSTGLRTNGILPNGEALAIELFIGDRDRRVANNELWAANNEWWTINGERQTVYVI